MRSSISCTSVTLYSSLPLESCCEDTTAGSFQQQLCDDEDDLLKTTATGGLVRFAPLVADTRAENSFQ